MKDRVKIVIGASNDMIPQISKKLGITSFDVIFIDHWKDRYLPDLKLLEQHNLMHKGTVIVADNILLPGVPDYRQYVETSPKYKTVLHEVTMSISIKDAVAVSIFQG